MNSLRRASRWISLPSPSRILNFLVPLTEVVSAKRPRMMNPSLKGAKCIETSYHNGGSVSTHLLRVVCGVHAKKEILGSTCYSSIVAVHSKNIGSWLRISAIFLLFPASSLLWRGAKGRSESVEELAMGEITYHGVRTWETLELVVYERRGVALLVIL